MSILNYFFIGTFLVFLIDYIMGIKKVQNHPKIQKIGDDWGWQERITCICIWPIAILVFLNSFFKAYLKK